MLQLAPCRIWLAESQRLAGGEPNESAELRQCLNPLIALKKQHLENLNDPNTSPTPQPGILLKLSAYVNSLKSQVIIRNWGYGTHFMAEETGSTPESLRCTVIRWLASHTQLHPHSPLHSLLPLASCYHTQPLENIRAPPSPGKLPTWTTSGSMHSSEPHPNDFI